MRNGLAAVAIAVALLANLGAPTESWAQTKVARVGILSFYSMGPEAFAWFEAFRHTLADHGWIKDKNMVFEFRSAQSDPSRLAKAATELVQRKVDVILAVGAPCVRAAHAATRTIPIVATDYTTDPVAEGYVQSYSRPGGNITGTFLDAPELAGKWFQLLTAIVPRLARVAVLWDPSPGAAHLRAVQDNAQSLGIQLQVAEVRKPDEIETAFARLRGSPQALIILPSPMIYDQSKHLADLALKYRLPATSMDTRFALNGGAVSYGPDDPSSYERNAILIGKILGGDKPGDLPVERPTKVQLVINLKTAKALGLTVPESVLYRADEVIR